MVKTGSVLMQQYEFGKFLGQGSFGKVYHARNLKTGMNVAVKIIEKATLLKAEMEDRITREISVMRLVNHPNVVQLYEVLASKKNIYYIMEYMKGGELFQKVAKGKLKPDLARKYFRQLIRAVEFCHSRGVYHRDLKLENLLLDEKGDLKVSDFGLSALEECKQQDGLLHTACGTPAYVAPEVINTRGYDGYKADIWSCGVILYVLLAGYLPFQEKNLMEHYRKIGKAEFEYPKWISPGARELISQMLDPDPSTRISISRIVDNVWFRKGCQSRGARTDHPDSQTVREASLDSDATLYFGTETDSKLDNGAPRNLNAFDIISLSAGFDLSGLFDENGHKKEAKFTSKEPVRTIISKLEDIAKRLKMIVTKKEGVSLKFESSRKGRKGKLSIDAEIFEFAQSFHLIEMKKSNGDTLEYQKVMQKEIRPSLKDIVWTWQGD